MKQKRNKTMDRVEEKALKAYPKMSRITEPHGVIPADNVSHLVGDGNAERRDGFIVGYRQAEKDLALTWQDIRDIVSIYLEEGRIDAVFDVEKHCKKVLKRFNEIKKE